MFVRHYSNNLLPVSFNDFFKDIPLNEQKSRDDDYNLKQKSLNLKYLFYYPTVQLIRTWNQCHITLKAQGNPDIFKSDFITSKLNMYDDECTKTSCYICKR